MRITPVLAAWRRFAFALVAVTPLAVSCSDGDTVQVPAGQLSGESGSPHQLGPETVPDPPLAFAPGLIDFRGVRVNTEASRALRVTNQSGQPIQLDEIVLEGDGAAEYVISPPGQVHVTPEPVGSGSGASGPIILQPGETRVYEVQFRPVLRGARPAKARFVVAGGLPPEAPDSVRLRGVGIGVRGAEHFVNAAGERYYDGGGQEWAPDFGYKQGSLLQTVADIQGTTEDALYQRQREGLSMTYAFPVVHGGRYEVTLHLAELVHASNGARIFDVFVEGALGFDHLDVHALAGFQTAHQVSYETTVTDGVLNLSFQRVIGEACVGAIEVRGVPFLVSSPTEVDFGAVAAGNSVQQMLSLNNEGVVQLSVDQVEILLAGSGNGSATSVTLGGNTYAGGTGDVSHAIDKTIGPGQSLPVQLDFSPTQERYDAVTVRFSGPFGSLDVSLTGLGGHDGDPFLHVVIDAVPYAVDYDTNGSEVVALDGSLSHTHEPGRALVGFAWDDGGPVFSTDPVTTHSLALGAHQVSFEITDDNVPARTLSNSVDIDVVPVTQVPGVMALYYPTGPGGASALLDAVPPNAEFVELLETYLVEGPSRVGGSPYAQDVMVQLAAEIEVVSPGLYDFVASGGASRRLELAGLPFLGPIGLAPGRYMLEARFAVDSTTELPLQVTVSIDTGPQGPVDGSTVTHDESGFVPVINSMPSAGTELGGNRIELDGYGFFPADQVTVHWGGEEFTQGDFLILEPDRIEFLSPAGTGLRSVTVETPGGTSNARTFEYSPDGPVPINFVAQPEVLIPSPTAGTWGPDGRFYALGRTGGITAIDFDENYDVVSQVTYPGVSGLTNADALGIAVNPFDPPDPVRLYVGHGQLFVNGGSSFTGPSPYTGQVSLLEGPSFDSPQPLITGLPVSNHDHGVNGLVFDNNGDLLICVGGTTNAGVAHPNSGDLPESPLSGAILKAEFTKPGFNGVIEYFETATGQPNDDQVDGEKVDVGPGIDVYVFASGFRNSFDIVYTTGKQIYVTDNGPNTGFGAASTGPSTEAPDPFDQDELELVERGNYYGHPNRSRGRYDVRQNLYYDQYVDAVPETFTQVIGSLNSSTNGIDEYRADTFQGQMRGDLVLQKWSSQARRIELTPDGRKVTKISFLYPWTGALGLRTGPGGALLAIKYSTTPTGNITVLEPDDPSAVGLVVHDIFPWRAPATGGYPFVIGGVGFGTLANTSVTIGGRPATLTEVSSKRIEGIVPMEPSPTQPLRDVVVTVGTESDTLVDAFRFLFLEGSELGVWRSLAATPTPLGEVTAAQVEGVLYLTGEGGNQTFAYDLMERLWLPNRAARPYPGHHQSVEVVDGKLYYVGGLDGNSEGKVQIYDPQADSWSLGADMPWAGGSVSTAVIDHRIYASGGIVGSTTVANNACYDPVTDMWTSLAPMPEGRNHAAAATDGQSFFVIGGRDGGNVVSNGFDDVQVYDPVVDSWESSAEAGSSLRPLPIGRGGMGKGIYHMGEVYVFGGETATGPGAKAGNVYDRVDVYDPVANTWRIEAPLRVPRHGVHPVLFQGIVFLPAGGVQAGNSQSTIFDLFHRQ